MKIKEDILKQYKIAYFFHKKIKKNSSSSERINLEWIKGEDHKICRENINWYWQWFYDLNEVSWQRRENERLKNENNKLKCENDELKNLKEENLRRIDELTNKNMTLNVELDNLHEQVRLLTDKSWKMYLNKPENEHLKTDDLTSEKYNELQKKYKELEEQNVNINKHTSSLDENNDKLRQENNELKKNHELSKGKLSPVPEKSLEQNSKLLEQFDELQNNLKNLNDKYEKLNETHELLTWDYEELKSKNENKNYFYVINALNTYLDWKHKSLIKFIETTLKNRRFLNEHTTARLISNTQNWSSIIYHNEKYDSNIGITNSIIDLISSITTNKTGYTFDEIDIKKYYFYYQNKSGIVLDLIWLNSNFLIIPLTIKKDNYETESYNKIHNKNTPMLWFINCYSKFNDSKLFKSLFEFFYMYMSIKMIIYNINVYVFNKILELWVKNNTGNKNFQNIKLKM